MCCLVSQCVIYLQSDFNIYYQCYNTIQPTKLQTINEMTKILTKKRQVKARIDIAGTLNSLELGESVVFNYRQAKTTAVRIAVTRIRQKTKKDFTATERGLVGEILVVRTR